MTSILRLNQYASNYNDQDGIKLSLFYRERVLVIQTKLKVGRNRAYSGHEAPISVVHISSTLFKVVSYENTKMWKTKTKCILEKP